MIKVLVTGYGGFLGAEIVRELLSTGMQVRGIARNLYPDLRELGIETVQGDIRSRDTTHAAVADCDAIIHTAANAGIWGAWQNYFDINTLATSHLLEAAHQRNIKAFVFSSSPSVTFAGEPQSGVDESVPYPTRWLCYYPQTKALAEQSVLEAAQVGQVNTCALRPHLIWGENDPHLFPRVVQRAREGKLRRVGSGANLIDTVHVKHAAQAHVAALKRLLDDDKSVNGEAFFLSDDHPVGCWDWITTILGRAEVSVPSRSISYPNAYRLGAALEAIYWTLRIQREPPMTRFVAAQLALDHYFDIGKAKRLLGYAPFLDREQELDRCASWLKRLGQSG